MKLIKIGSGACGGCSRMSHYDEALAIEYGYEWQYLKKGTTAYTENAELIAAIREHKGSPLGFPTYAIMDGDTITKVFAGAMPKNKFREQIEPRGGEEQKYYNVVTFIDEPDLIIPGDDVFQMLEGYTKWDGPDMQSPLPPSGSGWKTKQGEKKKENVKVVCYKRPGSDTLYPTKPDGESQTNVSKRGDIYELIWYKEDDGGDGGGGDGGGPIDPGPAPEPGPPPDPCEGVECPDHQICRSGKCADRCPDPCLYWDGSKCAEIITPPVPPQTCPPVTCDQGIIGFSYRNGYYGATFDQSRIRNVTPINVGDTNSRAFIVEFRPGACNPDQIANSFCVVDNQTAQGNAIISVDSIDVEKISEYVFKVTVKGQYYNNCTNIIKPSAAARSPEYLGPVSADPRCGGYCAGGDQFEIQKPDAKCKNTIHFRGRETGKEFAYESKNTGKYDMDFEANDTFDIWFTSTCSDFDKYGHAKTGDNGRKLYLEDDDDADYTDLIIKCWEGQFHGEWKADGSIENSLCYTTSGKTCPEGCDCIGGQCGGAAPPAPTDPCDGVVCPPGQTCINGVCYDSCGNQCPEGTECVNGQCQYTATSGAFFPAAIRYECCPDCKDHPTGGGDIDGNLLGCDNRPDPDPVPGSDTAADVYLYDRLNHTYKFCCPILADVTWLLPFDVLPPVFQRYITTVASVRAAAQMIDNPQLFQLLKDRENILRMECNNYEMEQGDLNYLNQPDHSMYLSYQTIQTLNR